MTLREQMEAALVANEVCSPYELEQQHEKSILDALLPVVESAVAAERERCARIAGKWRYVGNDEARRSAINIAAAIRAA